MIEFYNMHIHFNYCNIYLWAAHTKAPPNQYSNYQYYNPDKASSEQKDIIISQLKKENFELKQMVNDQSSLKIKNSDLEYKINKLTEENVYYLLSLLSAKIWIE